MVSGVTFFIVGAVVGAVATWKIMSEMSKGGVKIGVVKKQEVTEKNDEVI